MALTPLEQKIKEEIDKLTLNQLLPPEPPSYEEPTDMTREAMVALFLDVKDITNKGGIVVVAHKHNVPVYFVRKMYNYIQKRIAELQSLEG